MSFHAVLQAGGLFDHLHNGIHILVLEVTLVTQLTPGAFVCNSALHKVCADPVQRCAVVVVVRQCNILPGSGFACRAADGGVGGGSLLGAGRRGGHLGGAGHSFRSGRIAVGTPDGSIGGLAILCKVKGHMVRVLLAKVVVSQCNILPGSGFACRAADGGVGGGSLLGAGRRGGHLGGAGYVFRSGRIAVGTPDGSIGALAVLCKVKGHMVRVLLGKVVVRLFRVHMCAIHRFAAGLCDPVALAAFCAGGFFHFHIRQVGDSLRFGLLAPCAPIGRLRRWLISQIVQTDKYDFLRCGGISMIQFRYRHCFFSFAHLSIKSIPRIHRCRVTGLALLCAGR